MVRQDCGDSRPKCSAVNTALTWKSERGPVMGSCLGTMLCVVSVILAIMSLHQPSMWFVTGCVAFAGILLLVLDRPRQSLPPGGGFGL